MTAAGRSRRRLADVYREILCVPATEVGAVAYLPAALAQVSLPYRPVRGPLFRRRGGKLAATFLAPPGGALPWGRYPRLFLLWLGTRALQQHRREVSLDVSLSACLRQLGLPVSGGRGGTIARFRRQVETLLTTRVTLRWDGDGAPRSFRVARRSRLWWGGEGPADGAAAGERQVVLSRGFYDELTARPLPVDLRACCALRSALALDVYTWLCYRLFALRAPVCIGWGRLHRQFGSRMTRRHDFRRAFLRVLPDVMTVYPLARFRKRPEGLLLLPSPPSVPPRPRRQSHNRRTRG